MAKKTASNGQGNAGINDTRQSLPAGLLIWPFEQELLLAPRFLMAKKGSAAPSNRFADTLPTFSEAGQRIDASPPDAMAAPSAMAT